MSRMMHTPPNSRPAAFRAIVWLGMLFGWVVPAAVGWQLSPLVLLLVFPALSFALSLFLRPRAEGPMLGPLTDIGCTLGHAWVEVNGEYVYVDDATTAQLEGNVERAATGESTLSGFRVHLQPRVVALPDGGVFGRRTIAALVLGSFVYLYFFVFLPEAVSEAANLTELFANSAFALLPAVTVSICPGIGAWIVTKPYQMVFDFFRRRLVTAGPGLDVELNGLLLTAGSARFHLGEPGRRVWMEATSMGYQLVLENDRERIEVPGRYAELAWLQRHLEAVDASEVGSEAVPESLREGLRRASGVSET